MEIIFYLFLFLLGSIMWSFCGVIIERGRGGFEWTRWKEIFGGRSYCPGCGHSLTWWQLIPFVGWLLQKGKCFRCDLQIPMRYNRLELSMGLVFVTTSRFVVGNELTGVLLWYVERQPLVFWLLVNWAFWWIIIADFFWYELNVYLRLFLVLRIAGRGAFGEIASFDRMFLRGVAWTAIFWCIWRVSKRYVRAKLKVDGEGIGEGDIMIALVVGLLFPFLAWTNYPISGIQMICVYLIGSSALGILFWLGRLAISGDENHMLPFLPAMIVAFWLLLAFADNILSLIAI